MSRTRALGEMQKQFLVCMVQILRDLRKSVNNVIDVIEQLFVSVFRAQVRVWDSNKWELRVSVPAHKELDGGVTRLAWHPLLPIVLSSGTDLG